MTTLQLSAFVPPTRLLFRLRLWIVLGAIGTAIALVSAPKLALGGLLVGASYTLSLGLGALVIIAMDYITKAGWGAALRRIPEAMAATMPVTCLIVFLVLAGGLPWLYPWAHAPAEAHGPVDASLAWWRQPAFFLARAAGCMILWIMFMHAILRNSRRQDTDGDLRATHRNVRLSALFIVVYGITLSLASFDWLMGLQAHWYSTMLAAYEFFGSFEAALAAIIVVVILLSRAGYLRQVLRPAHLHDLGKYLFCFATFWGYIWFSQYMLIWYSNIPEETSYFVLRHSSGWFGVSVVSVLLNWALPFFILLSSSAKRNERVLFRAAIIVLIGHWIDLYGVIIPPLAGPDSFLNLWPLIPSVMLVPLFVVGMLRTLRSVPLIPSQDPMLVESLHSTIGP